MKILLDECLPVDFRNHFPVHDAQTVQWAGLKGKQNGELLRAAAGFDVLLTVDQGIPHQLPSGLGLAVVLIRSRTNQLEDLASLAATVLEAIEGISCGQVRVVKG